MAKTLTAPAVEKLRAGKARREIPDGGCRGLYLLIGTSGQKSWTYRFRRPSNSKSAKLTLGTVDLTGRKPLLLDKLKHGMALTLAEARTLATQAAMAVANDLDPAIERQDQKAKRKVEASTADQRTFPAMARIYIERKAKPHRRDWRDLARKLGLNPDEDGMPIIPGSIAQRWESRAAASIDKVEVVEALDDAVKNGRGPTAGNHLLAALRVMFRWHVRRSALISSPCELVEMPVAHKSLKRTRRLSNDEMHCLWMALDDAVKADEVPAQYGAMLRFLTFTLTRRDEVREMIGTEISGSEWVVPGARTKNHLDHLVSLTPAAVKELPDGRVGKQGLVFTIDGAPLGSLSKWKRRLDLHMLTRLKGIALGRDDQVASARWEEIEWLIKLSADPKASEADKVAARERLKREWWQLHDLRRSGRSYLSKVELPDIAERCLGHIIEGVRSHYDLHDFKEEKARALAKWAQEVRRIVSTPPGGKVIAMPGRKRGQP